MNLESVSNSESTEEALNNKACDLSRNGTSTQISRTPRNRTLGPRAPSDNVFVGGAETTPPAQLSNTFNSNNHDLLKK